MPHAFPIAWSEGMFVEPEHFLAQDRYHERRQHRFFAAAQGTLCGVWSLCLDTEALNDNRLVLRELECLMPSGVVLTASSITAPLQLEIPSPGLVQKRTIGVGRDIACTAGALGEHRVVEESCSAAGTELAVMMPQARLMVAPEQPLAGEEFLPLCRLYVSEQRWHADPDFYPPALDINALPQLRKRLESLLRHVRGLRGHAQSSHLALGELERVLELATLGIWRRPAELYAALYQTIGRILAMRGTAGGLRCTWSPQRLDEAFDGLLSHLNRLLQELRADDCSIQGRMHQDSAGIWRYRSPKPYRAKEIGIALNLDVPCTAQEAAQLLQHARFVSHTEMTRLLEAGLPGLSLHSRTAEFPTRLLEWHCRDSEGATGGQDFALYLPPTLRIESATLTLSRTARGDD